MENGTFENLLEKCYDPARYGFIWGFPGEIAESADKCLMRRSSLDTVMVEKAVAVLCGALCGLVPDETIFRRMLPPGMKKAAAVRLESEIPCSEPEYRRWQVSFSGRDDDVRKWQEICGKLCGKLPLPAWVTVDMIQEKSHIQVAVLKQLNWENGETANSGNWQSGTEIALELLVKV